MTTYGYYMGIPVTEQEEFLRLVEDDGFWGRPTVSTGQSPGTRALPFIRCDYCGSPVKRGEKCENCGAPHE